MPNDENAPPSQVAGNGNKRPRGECPEEDAYTSGPSKRGVKTDCLVHCGRHYGRTVRAFVNFQSLISEGILREEQLAANKATIDELEDEDRKEHELFRELMKLCPFLSDKLFRLGREDSDISYAATMLSKGASSARSDDVKTLKSAVIDWITPPGGVLTPNIQRHSKDGRGFYHDTTGRYLCPTDYNWADPMVKLHLKEGKLVASGLQWPMLLYAGLKCNEDNMWDGLFRGRILVQAYKHVFTSPSSVHGESRATRSGNAQLHGMTTVTVPSIAYIATLVRFSLSSVNTFCCTDKATDHQRFYNTIVDFLEMEDEQVQVEELLNWWNRQIFPSQSAVGYHTVPNTSALAKLTEQRKQKKTPALAQNGPAGNSAST